MPPTPIPLGKVLQMKLPDDSFLMQELSVRLANRIAHLDTLPDLERSRELREVRTKFLHSFTDLRKLARKNASSEDLAEVIKGMLSRHSNHAHKLNLAMRAWREEHRHLDEQNDKKTRSFVDTFLNRFCLSWIGIEALSSQYLALSTKRCDFLFEACDPTEVCELASRNVFELAKAQLNRPPRVEVSYHGPPSARTLPLIPSYLYYVVEALLKNSVRAVGELHEASGEPGMPFPIFLRISADADQVALQIADRGGGIPFVRQPRIWSYEYSTAPGTLVCPETGMILRQTSNPTPLSGSGCGLPLSRLYAEYIGGTVHVMSMPNFGTNAYIFLSRNSYDEEALPNYVDWLCKERLRQKLATLEKAKNDAVDAQDFFEAAQIKGLINEVKVELAQIYREGLFYNSMDGEPHMLPESLSASHGRYW